MVNLCKKKLLGFDFVKRLFEIIDPFQPGFARRGLYLFVQTAKIVTDFEIPKLWFRK